MNASLKPAAEPAPKAYAAFAPVLDRLSTAMRETVFGQLAELERFARAFAVQRFAETGDFEGLGSLTQRGDISQIVQSELLLRSEAPMEFLRRLAESETLFFEKQYADPGARTLYRAMISIGPGMLGHGRVVALAALLFLARIAQDRGAAFHWCVLPREGGAVWWEGVHPRSVKKLLNAASYREMSVGDAAEALEIWNGDDADKAVRGRFDLFDWMVGATPVDPAARRDLAVEQADNSLTFHVSPPRSGEARSVVIQVRLRRRETGRATVAFPGDGVCVSALNNPFRPIDPVRGELSDPGARSPIGWAPEHLTWSNGGEKVVRLHDGVLVVTVDKRLNPVQLWFAPLDPSVRLAGVKANNGALHLLTEEGPDRPGLVMRRFALFGSGTRQLLESAVGISTEQLFRKQSPHALPALSFDDKLTFFSHSGHAYRLLLSHDARAAQFTPQHDAPRIIRAEGDLLVFRGERLGEPALTVAKNGVTMVDAFPDNEEAPVSVANLRGLAYSRGDRSLAYSIRPNRWVIPSRFSGPPGAVAVRSLTVEPHETVLMGRPEVDGLLARIWSDARAGGAGTIRTIREYNGEVALRQPVLHLGSDAANIARIISADDGYWGVSLDEKGWPDQLFNWRPKRIAQGRGFARFNLAELRDKAVVVE